MLTEMMVRQAKPREKMYKLFDEKGMYLLVTPKGGKYWRYDFRINGKRKTLSLGVYPETSLKDARLKRDELRLKLKDGYDPALERKQQTEPHREKSFKTIAEEWFKTNNPRWRPGHSRTILYRMQKYIIPAIGSKTPEEITQSEILELLKNIEITGHINTAHKIKQILSGIFTFAMDLNLCSKNPVERVKKYIAPIPPKHYPAILEPEKVGDLLRKVAVYPNIVIRSAIQMLALTFVRPGELRLAKWNEFDLNNRIWDIPAERMKMKKPHRVFLSKQTIDILTRLKKITGNHEYVFTGRNIGEPISDATVNRALQRLGFDTKKDITGHGFRAMARTLIHEKLGYPPEVIEHQLAHDVPDMLGQAYNRTKFYDQRKKMMQDWADYLDKLSENGNI